MSKVQQSAGKLALIGAMAILLAACNSGDKKSSTSKTLELGQLEKISDAPVDQSQNLRAFCPRTVLRDGTETYRTFANGVKKTDPDAMASLEFQFTITKVVRECNYTANNLNIRVGVRGQVINGPTGAFGDVNVPVRVAVVDNAQNVLYSQLNQVPVSIPPGGSNARFSFVDSNLNFPVPDKPNMIIYVGFDEGPPEGVATQ